VFRSGASKASSVKALTKKASIGHDAKGSSDTLTTGCDSD
jgi:hypothetical protein